MIIVSFQKVKIIIPAVIPALVLSQIETTGAQKRKQKQR